MSNGMYQQPQCITDQNTPVQRLAEKGGVDVGDKDGGSSLERLMQEKDGDTSLFTAMNEVDEVLTQHQTEACDLAPALIENLEPSNYTYSQVSPTAVYPNQMQLVYLQPTQNGLCIIPCQVAGQPSFIPPYPSGLHGNIQHPMVAQPGPPFAVPSHSVYDGSYSYSPSTYPTYGSMNLQPHFIYDQSRMNQPLHTPTSPFPYPVNGVINPLPYPVSVPTNQSSYPQSPTNITPYPASPYPNLTPYSASQPFNPMPYPQFGYGPVSQGQRMNTPHYFDHEPANNVAPVTYQDTAALTPTTTTVVQSTVEKRFFRPWEGGGEDRLQQLREEDQSVSFSEEDFPALNKVFDKMKIKN